MMIADARNSTLPPSMPSDRDEDEALKMQEPLERVSFELADFVNTRIPGVAQAWNTAFMGFMLWGAGGRRIEVLGLEHVPYGKRDRILLLANHRSFFDFFVMMASWHQPCPCATSPTPSRANAVSRETARKYFLR